MAPTRWNHQYHAPSVEACWQIAYRETQRLQRLMTHFNLRGNRLNAEACRECRDVADRIARTIKYGPQKRRRRGRKRT